MRALCGAIIAAGFLGVVLGALAAHLVFGRR